MLLAIVAHPGTRHNAFLRVLWAACVYLEAVSVLPQLRMMQARGGGVECSRSRERGRGKERRGKKRARGQGKGRPGGEGICNHHYVRKQVS